MSTYPPYPHTCVPLRNPTFLPTMIWTTKVVGKTTKRSKFLRGRPDLIVWSADKNLGPVLTTKHKYATRVLTEHLSNPSVYQRLSPTEGESSLSHIVSLICLLYDTWYPPPVCGPKHPTQNTSYVVSPKPPSWSTSTSPPRYISPRVKPAQLSAWAAPFYMSWAAGRIHNSSPWLTYFLLCSAIPAIFSTNSPGSLPSLLPPACYPLTLFQCTQTLIQNMHLQPSHPYLTLTTNSFP